MVYNTHCHIKDEHDLDSYEKFLEYENGYEHKECFEKNVCKMTAPKKEIQTGCTKPYAYNTKSIIPDTLTNSVFFQGYLKNHIGKLIRVESLIGNSLESRIGKLLEVGTDYIVIKLHIKNCSMVINTASIKYITIAHNNILHK